MRKTFLGFFEFGSIGVDFFFVLSGFIIYWVHSKDEQGINHGVQYLKKRIVRIYPPFILISITLLIAYHIFPSLSQGNRNIGIITSLFLIPTPPLSPALSVSWTLMHEMLFYLIFLSLYFNRKLLFSFLLLWSVSIILVDFTSIQGITRTFILNPHNFEFVLGVLAAIIIKKEQGNILQLIIGLIMFFLYVYFYQIIDLESKSLLLLKIYLGISFMLIVTGLCSIDDKIKYPKFLLLLGSASYSIYLIHNPAISILNRIAQKSLSYWYINPNIIFIMVAISSIALGLIYFYIWENPMLKILKKKIL